MIDDEKFEQMSIEDLRKLSREKDKIGNATREAYAAQEELYRRSHGGLSSSEDSYIKEKVPDYAELEDSWREKEYINNRGRRIKKNYKRRFR